MVTGKAFHQHRSEFVFAIHEYVFIGYEHVIQHNHGFLAGKLFVACIQPVAFHAAGVAGLPSVYISNTFCIDGDSADDGVVIVCFAKTDGGHDHDPVRIHAAGLVGFGAADIDTFVGAPGHMNVKVRVALLMRRLAAISFYIGHGAADHVSGRLRHGNKIPETLVVIAAVGGVDLKSD